MDAVGAVGVRGLVSDVDRLTSGKNKGKAGRCALGEFAF